MAKKSPYSPPPYIDREASYHANLKARTGLTMDEWIALVRREGPATEKACRMWLKETHGLTTIYAGWVAERAAGKDDWGNYDPDASVKAMYAAKPALKPIHDALVKRGLQLGDDVKVCPCQTIVPFYRKHVFAQIKPSTKTRLDLGFALAETPFNDRLVDTGGRAKKDRITHRIGLSCVEDIDDEVRHWLKVAYDLDAAEKPKVKKPEAIAPADLLAALALHPTAKAAWEKLAPSHRRAHVESIEEAKKPETRARRIAKAVEVVAKGK